MSPHSSDSEASATGAGGGHTTSSADDVRTAFSALAFDQKISTLIQIELDMLGDAAEAVVSAASKAIDEIANACSERADAATPGGQASAN